MEVCIGLNLMSGVNFHQPLANYKLNEMDQAKYVTFSNTTLR